MEKKCSCWPFDLCEKLFKAITVVSSSPSSSRPIIHHHPQDSMATNPDPNPSTNSTLLPVVKTHNHHSQDHPNSATQNNNGNVASSVAPSKNMEPMSQFVPGIKDIAAAELTRMESDNNKMNANIEEDEFAEYIKRAGKKIRGATAASATGREDTGSGSNDNFSDYISRAKKRMLRTMSSFVGGRSSDSMK